MTQPITKKQIEARAIQLCEGDDPRFTWANASERSRKFWRKEAREELAKEQIAKEANDATAARAAQIVEPRQDASLPWGAGTIKPQSDDGPHCDVMIEGRIRRLALGEAARRYLPLERPTAVSEQCAAQGFEDGAAWLMEQITEGKLRAIIRESLDEVETDALVTVHHADALADELAALLLPRLGGAL